MTHAINDIHPASIVDSSRQACTHCVLILYLANDVKQINLDWLHRHTTWCSKHQHKHLCGWSEVLNSYKTQPQDDMNFHNYSVCQVLAFFDWICECFTTTKARFPYDRDQFETHGWFFKMAPSQTRWIQRTPPSMLAELLKAKILYQTGICLYKQCERYISRYFRIFWFKWIHR